MLNGAIMISWRQKVLERQIDYGAKLGQVVLSLARMELNNFYKNVMPVADYFDQSNMLISVSWHDLIFLFCKQQSRLNNKKGQIFLHSFSPLTLVFLMQIGGNKENSGAFKVVCLGLPVIQSSDFDPAITRRRHDFPISVKCVYSVCVNCSFQTLLSRRIFSVDTFNLSVTIG
jgi:hypothetical protein